MQELPTVIPRCSGEVFAWLAQHRVPSDGAPFIRYHTIDMGGVLDIEIGVPVASPISSNEHLGARNLPAGRYATLVYTGPYDGLMHANAVLLDWGKGMGLVWDQSESANGDAFRATPPRSQITRNAKRRWPSACQTGNPRHGHSKPASGGSRLGSAGAAMWPGAASPHGQVPNPSTVGLRRGCKGAFSSACTQNLPAAWRS